MLLISEIKSECLPSLSDALGLSFLFESPPPEPVTTLTIYYLSWSVGEDATVLCTNGSVSRWIISQDCVLATGILPESVTIMSRFAPVSVKHYYSFVIFIYSP